MCQKQSNFKVSNARRLRQFKRADSIKNTKEENDDINYNNNNNNSNNSNNNNGDEILISNKIEIRMDNDIESQINFENKENEDNNNNNNINTKLLSDEILKTLCIGYKDISI